MSSLSASTSPFHIAFIVVTVGGALLLVMRHGLRSGAPTGPAAGEAAVEDVPLADPARWFLGILYLAPGHPAVFVEKRVGLGFTLNLGNPRVLLCLAVLLAAAGAIPVLGG